MKIIQRKQLGELINLRRTPDIKIITGVRRSGKSFLLRQLEGHIKQHEPQVNIISLDLTAAHADQLYSHQALYQHITDRYQPDTDNVLLIDEIEMCPQFELAINALYGELKYDIYLTGSNAFLFSSDLATLFAGRYFPVEVFPFSFLEFIDYFDYQLSDLDVAFDRYLLEGGFAGSYTYPDMSSKKKYIKNIYQSMIIRDIEEKYHLRNPELLSSLGDFLMDNVGNLTSPRKIADTLNSYRQPVNHVTIGQYLTYFCHAFAFYPVGRYNIRGKLRLSNLDKYYLVDHTLRLARLGPTVRDTGRILENIVAIELLRRGCDLYVGAFDAREIDFVAIKDNQKTYLQVCANIHHPTTLDREMASLLKIRDSYPKLILTRTGCETEIDNGIQIVDIAHWLAGQ